MKAAFYIIADEWGVQKLAKRRSLPALQVGQVAVRLSIEIPDACFNPQPAATIKVPPEHVVQAKAESEAP